MTVGRGARAVLVPAWAASVAIGLVFVFVKAPHPWGWEGFDDYRALAMSLARGEPYPTLERTWGYPAFLALFYRAFGDRQWLPLIAQVLLNSAIPLIVYDAVGRRVGEREARAAAVAVALFSFNTVYASTQTSDSLCTCLFVASVGLFLRAQDRSSAALFAGSGLLAGAAMQVRPNMLLLPVWLAVVALLAARPRLAARHAAAYAAAAYVVLIPWIVRNARLTGRFIPASTHGGVQLWYGSLQVPPYFPNWFDNPRAIYGERPFAASRPDGRPHVISVEQPRRDCPGVEPVSASVTYWTDRRAAPTTLAAQPWRDGGVTFEIPPQPDETAIYFYAESSWPSPGGGPMRRLTPFAGPTDPLVHFVTTRTFGDLDRHNDLIDLFDIVALVRHRAWHEAPAAGAALDLDGDGTIADADLEIAVGALFSDKRMPVAVPVRDVVAGVTASDAEATLRLKDGSTLSVPRAFSGRELDLTFHGEMAQALLNSRRSRQSLRLSSHELPSLAGFTIDPCRGVDSAIDRVPYRSEPQMQDWYLQLARDNMRRSPLAYAAASARRIAGQFVIVGSGDRDTAHQFSMSRLLYLAATVVSLAVTVLFVAGIAASARRGADVVVIAAAVLYVPITICPVLTNARYAVSAQPFVLAFAACAAVSLFDRISISHRRARHG